jgi:hypothetical protein
MTQEMLRALPDVDLTQVIAWAQAEIKARAEKRKQETISKIKELAGSVGLAIAIGGAKGRPVGRTMQAKAKT